MEMNGEELINASRATVWAALNDPEMLKLAIPGCQSVEKEGDDSFSAVVKVKVGPVKATFKGHVTLSNIDELNGYTITGEGKGGAAGFGKGGADISLSDADDGTLLKYDVKASVGGKMAQIGSRLIDSTAKKLAGEFFSKFNEIVSASEETGDHQPELPENVPAANNQETVEKTAEEKPATSTPSSSNEQQSGWMKPSVMIPVIIVAVLVIYFLTKGP